MKYLSRLFVTSLFCFVVLAAGVPITYAGCMDNAGDAIFGFLSGGLSVAACELKELVDAIQNFIKTVSDLASNVANNAKAVADAAVGAVNAAADDVTGTVTGAQRDLGNAVSEAQAMTSPLTMAPNANIPLSGTGTAAPGRVGAAVPKVAPLATTSGPGKTGPNPRVATAPILLPADPQRLHAALVRGAQELGTLKTSVDQDAAGRINTAVQRARNQATTHLADAADIVKTALLAPINALLTMLNDLVNHPTTLLDPIATINGMVNDISKNIVDTMNHINDVITKDAINTLGGIEGDVQRVQGEAQTGGKLLNAMRRAHQEKTQAALVALESQLNALAPTQGGFGRSRALAMPAQTAFRFAPVQSRLHATLQKSVVPYHAISSNLKTNWAKIQTLHLAAKPRPLDAHTKQTAQTQLDQLFRGKSPADVERTKQNLLNQARSKYGSDPKVMAAIEKNLNGYVQVHVAPAALSTNPGGKQKLNPQPLPPQQ
jgi:hypothetical protein